MLISFIFLGISFSFSFGIMICFNPLFLAAYIFSNIPPTFLMFPLIDISPVMAIF